MASYVECTHAVSSKHRATNFVFHTACTIVLEIPIVMVLIFSRFYKNFVIMEWGIKDFELSNVPSNKFDIPFGIDKK